MVVYCTLKFWRGIHVQRFMSGHMHSVHSNILQFFPPSRLLGCTRSDVSRYFVHEIKICSLMGVQKQPLRLRRRERVHHQLVPFLRVAFDQVGEIQGH